MIGSDAWRAEVSIEVGLRLVGPFQLPSDESVRLGRSADCGLRVNHPAISRELATFSPTHYGWVLENGARTRVALTSPFVVKASFGPRAQALLQPADWALAWDLDVYNKVTVTYRRAGHGEPLAVARDKPTQPKNEAASDPQQRIGTGVAGDRLKLTPLQRRRLGALFAYLIEETEKPDQLIQTAAQLSGDSIAQINGTWVKVREYVNRHREVPIEHIEDLGYHLVVVAGVLGPDDVPQGRRRG